jgi:NAD(P)H-dependent FMN reductase
MEVTLATDTVGYFVGSLATAAINRKLALALVRLAPEELQFREIRFADLPPGKIGTAVGQQHLRSILAFCNSPMNSIEAYIRFTPGLIGDDGEVTDDSVTDFLRNDMAEFHGLITRVYTALPRNT